MTTNAIYDYWLARIHGVPSSVKILLDQAYGSAKEVYAASDSSLSRRRFMKPDHVSAISRSRQIWDLEGEYALMCKDGARMVIWKDEEYPYMLCLLHDMPYAVYAKGRLPDVSRPSIAIVGARSCSPYGKKQAEILSRALAEAGVNIISGMALGIDGIAQRAAVSCGGYSLGILGSGIDSKLQSDGEPSLHLEEFVPEGVDNMLKLFDTVGPHAFRKDTVAGPQALFHRSGGVIADAAKLKDEFLAPYKGQEAELKSIFDSATGGVADKAISAVADRTEDK